MGRYDTSLKELVLGTEPEFLTFLGINAQIMEITNVEFPAVKERRVDKVFKAIVEGEKTLIHIEFQLQYQQDFHIRMLEYWVMLKSRFPDYDIVQIVLTCGIKFISRLQQKEKLESFINFGFKVVDLNEIPFEKYLEVPNPNINALGIFGKGSDIKTLVERILKYNLEQEKFSSIVNKIFILSKLVGREKEVLKAMEDLAVIDIRETELFKRGEMEGIKKGREEGIKKGREEGIKEGLKIAKKLIKEWIEVALMTKFGPKSKGLIEKLKTIEDIEKLRKLRRVLLKAKSTKEIEKIISNSK